jgi:hypothetical protein
MLVRIFFLLFAGLSCLLAAATDIRVTSPGNSVTLLLKHEPSGILTYAVNYGTRVVIQPSSLGFRLSVPEKRLDSFDIVSIDSSYHDSRWQPVWGEVREIRNNYRELIVTVNQKAPGNIRLQVIFRVFDDGVGFRYHFPSQPNLNHFVIADELTSFRVGADHKVFWIPGDYDTNEFVYNTGSLSTVDASSGKMSQEIYAKTFFHKDAVQTPLMMKSADGLYINIHEAGLLNYPAMNLVVDKSRFDLKAHLVPDAIGNKAYLNTAFSTPWRTIIVSDKATSILASKLILNLNEPSRIRETSWIKPQKMVGVWWELHVGKSSWDFGATQSGSALVPHGRHGATTANVKRYIDFASKHGIEGVLVEGWNVGWEDWFGQWKEDVFDFVTPYPDFDVTGLRNYAASKNVKLVMHHETSASVSNYERWMDTAYRFMKNNGYDLVKTGYVGRIIPRGEHHDGQWMVKHYQRVLEKTAQYRIMVDAHEPVRPTGLHRTYPNYLACEAARGNEFNAWSIGNPPDHETILPFTRMMGGPMDYTPGIFRIKLNQFDPNKKEQVHTTLCKQLALYVAFCSPLQMAADLPENYETKLDAFQFIKDVAVDWDDSKYLLAEPGEFVVVTRKAKGKEDWFLGAITDEQARTFEVNLSFLDMGRKYKATIYRDGDGAHWKDNPEIYKIENFIVDNKTGLTLKLAEGGGTAIRFSPATADEVKNLKKYKK